MVGKYHLLWIACCSTKNKKITIKRRRTGNMCTGIGAKSEVQIFLRATLTIIKGLILYVWILNSPSDFIRTGTRLETVLSAKIDFLSGWQLKDSHGHPNGQSSLNNNWNYQCFKWSIIAFVSTWHGHWSYCTLNIFTHDCSQVCSPLQSMMHWPRFILFSFMHFCKLSSFWGDGFSPQTQIGFGQSLQPFGQLLLQGQS